jgi:hypothetical protein
MRANEHLEHLPAMASESTPYSRVLTQSLRITFASRVGAAHIIQWKYRAGGALTISAGERQARDEE